MRNLKRALCLALASVMVLGMTVIGASAATASDFTDYDSVEEKEALDVMAAINIIEGDGTGNFNPEGHFTREEAAKILSVMLLGSSNADKLNTNAQIFKDVAAGRWSAGYIAYCSNVGIIAGDGQGNFNPEGELDAVSFGKMLLVALGYDPAKEGYINNPGWQQSISGDMIVAGIDVGDVKFSDILTREQATVMAFNAIQTPLVEYSNYLDPNKATYVTTTIAKEQTISSQQLTNNQEYTIEFAEKYQQSLMRSPDNTEEFFRPAHKWTVGSTNIGRYTDTPDVVYTTKVTTGQIYNDLSLSETILVGEENLKKKDPNDETKEIEYDSSDYYIDGESSFYFADEKEYLPDEQNNTGTDDFTDGGVLKLRNKGDIELGGNGTLTEVYYSPVSYDSESGEKRPASAQIVSVNTYVGDVTAKVGETDKHIAYITITPRSEDIDYTTSDLQDPRPRPDNIGYENRYETEDFALEDLVIFTYSKRQENSKDLGIQSVKVAEVVTGELTAYTESERVAIDGESYSYSSKVAKEAHAVDKNYDVDVVLDDYGYAIDVDPVNLNTGYAVILNYKPTTGDWNDTAAAELLLTNGTTVDKALLINVEDTDAYRTGDIVSYKVDNRGKYELTLEANVNTYADESADVTENTNKQRVAAVNVEKGKSQIHNIVGTDASNNPIVAGGNTIFLLKDLDGNGDPIYYAYYGIKNVPTVITDSSDAYDATVLVKDSNVAVLVYIDASNTTTIIDTSNEDYAFVKYDSRVESKYDTERGEYYVYEAIVNGDITTIEVNTQTWKAMDSEDGEPITPQSTLFETVMTDDFDIYSLERPAASRTGVAKISNEVLSIGSTNIVASENCAVFNVDKEGVISESSVGAVKDDPSAIVWYITNESGELTCVVIVEQPQPNE